MPTAVRHLIVLLCVWLSAAQGFSVSAGVYPGVSAGTDCSKLESAADSVFAQPRYRRASYSFVIYDETVDRTVLSVHPDLALTQASVTKLLTTAAVLDKLGADAVFETGLAIDAPVENFCLKGNLWVVAGGDPSLGSEYVSGVGRSFLNIWVQKVKSMGIRKIDGRVCLDGGLYDEPLSSHWLWEDIGNYYAAGIYDVAVFDNMYRVSLKAGPHGAEVIGTEPEMPGLAFDNRVRLDNRLKDSVNIYGQDRQWVQQLVGSIPSAISAPASVVKGAIPDPERYLLYLLASQLQQAGIELAGPSPEEYLSLPLRPDGVEHCEGRVVSVYPSPPMSQLVRVTNVRSNNTYAEYLLRRLAWPTGGRPQAVSQEDGLEALSRHWQSKGFDTNDWLLADGCGLSPQTAFPAAALVPVLLYMDRQSAAGKAFVNSLPIAGKEGTVAGFCRSLPGVFRVKSGSMSGVRSYAGYYDWQGHRYVVSVCINRADAASAELMKDVETIMKQL